MRSESISRRLASLEAKVAPNLTPVEKMLCQNEGFIVMIRGEGVDIGDFKRKGLRALPHELKKLLVERLRAEINRRQSDCGHVAAV